MPINYTVVIPFKDEQDNIIPLIKELEPVMENLGKPWECIAIDDGSTDDTLSILKNLCTQKPFLRTLSFSRNFGQSNAFAAGFDAANGKYVITLDGDGQNCPSDIPNLIEAISGADLVVGWRRHRKDPWHKKMISKLSNFVRSRLCQDGVQDTGCSLKIYRRSALKKIKMYKGMHRFLPALFQIEGFKVKQIPVLHRPRARGKTKYHFFNRLLGPIQDMFVVAWMRKRHINYQAEEL